MPISDWAHLSRTQLTEQLPDSVVLLPIGATEQHGPHLATGADHLIAAAVSRRAGQKVGNQASVVLAPTIAIGASDHHTPFGGTISVRAGVLLAYLTDCLMSVATAGARRVLLVNGHGGNSGICHAAAAEASAPRGDQPALEFAAHIDYWSLIAPAAAVPPQWLVPGHAGAFETSVLAAITGSEDDAPASAPTREAPAQTSLDLPAHSARLWSEIDGYTDRPVEASRAVGLRVVETVTDALAEQIVQLAHSG